MTGDKARRVPQGLIASAWPGCQQRLPFKDHDTTPNWKRTASATACHFPWSFVGYIGKQKTSHPEMKETEFSARNSNSTMIRQSCQIHHERIRHREVLPPKRTELIGWSGNCMCVCIASNERRLRRIDQIDDDRKASKQKISDWCIRAQRPPSADLVADEKAAVSSLERWNTASLALNATSTLLHTENQIWLE